MSRTARTLVPAAALAALAAFPAAARADDAEIERVWETMSGEIRAGWRFLHDEEDGRFFQDRSLQDGPRIFDASLHGETEREDAAVTSFDAEAHGIGEEEQSWRLKFGRAGLWSVDGTLDRDDMSYRASGDPWPWDTVRERSGLRVRVTPSDRLTVRLDWNRSLRRGDAYLAEYTDRLDRSISGVDSVRDRRPLHQQEDRVTLGVDGRFDGGFRFSLAETGGLTQVDDTRLYDVPGTYTALGAPVRQALRRDVRAPAWTTVAKAGWRSRDGALDVEAIASWTRRPLDSRIGGSARGWDNAYDSMGVAPKGGYRAVTSGGNDTDRSAWNGRLETTWRPAAKWEFVAAAEQDDTVDDASLRLVERRDYDRTDVPVGRIRDAYDARIVNRMCRGSLEALWDPHDDWTFRLGEEILRENLRTPTDTRTSDFSPTNFSSTSWRTTAGADWRPRKGLDLSLLVRRGTNDDPHTATSAESSDEVSWRGRWKASEEWSLSTAWRHKGYRQDTDLDSASRSDSVTIAPSWTREGFSLTPSLTWQEIETRTDTTWFELTGGGFSKDQHQVSYRTRDLIASFDARWDLSKSLRAFLTVTWIDSRGDYAAAWDDASLGAEHDLRENLSVGAALRSWRLDEADAHADDYRVVGAEVWVTLRF